MDPVSARRTCMASTAKRAMSAAWLLDWSSTRLVPATYAAIGARLIVAVRGEMSRFQKPETEPRSRPTGLHAF